MFQQLREIFDEIRDSLRYLRASPFYKVSTDVWFSKEIDSIYIKSLRGDFELRAYVCNGEEFGLMVSGNRTYLSHTRGGFWLFSDSKLCRDEPQCQNLDLATFGWRIGEKEMMSAFKEVNRLVDQAIQLSASERFFCSSWKPSFLKKTLVRRGEVVCAVSIRDLKAQARVIAQGVVMEYITRHTTFDDLVRNCKVCEEFVDSVVFNVSRENPKVPSESELQKRLEAYLA